MAWTPPTNPEDSYELSPFGFGPFPLPGESVEVAPPHPFGGGYGGVGFLSSGDGVDGGSPYGLGSYGSRSFSRPEINISGGYGGDAYGFGGYGGTEATPPFVSSAISLNGYEVEVYFSEEVDTDNPALTDPASYTLEAILGAAPATVTAAHIEKLGSVNLSSGDTIAGAISVVITHTGTTQGGLYKVHATDLTDIAGNPIIDADAPFLAQGEPPSFIVSIPATDTGDSLLVTFNHPMLENAGGFSSLASYSFAVADSNSYPIDLAPQSIAVLSDQQVVVIVQGMTSLAYDLTVSDAFAFSFDTTNGVIGCVRVDLGTAVVSETVTYLVVSKEKNLAFSMEWQDTSGTIVPLTSTLRGDATFDFSSVAYDPVISVFASPEIAEVVVQDGTSGNGLMVRFILQLGITGQEQIRIRSGTYDQTIDATWQDAKHTLSFVRNMQAGIVTFLLDEAPLASTQTVNVDGVIETQPGIRFGLLNGGWDISGVRVYGCTLSNSITVFSAAWNFLHDQQVSFVGSSLLTRDYLLTQRGPLVKGWGDATPATEQDVVVDINGTAVEITDVNPYIGKITLAIPVPLLPVGTADVAVDYKWFKSPVMEMAGLNTEGLVLNKFDCPSRGHHDPASHGDQVQVEPGQPDFLAEPGIPKGAVDTHRFPMGVVLGPMDRNQPVYIGHRYMGFERAYSALTNSPTTLLLNQAPGRVAVDGFEREVGGVSVAYEGLVKPVEAAPAWSLDGIDYGSVDHDANTGLDLGTYTLIDPIVGEAGPLDTATVYHRGLDLTYPSSVNLVARFQASNILFDENHPSPDPALPTMAVAEGVFTGIGFGMHDNRHLYFVGILTVNGLTHVGLLLNPKRLHEWEAWDIGPSALLTATSQTTGSFPTVNVPTGFMAGSQFQQLSGTQRGVYTATSVVAQCDGTTTVVFGPALPSNFDIFGNKYAEMVFETRAYDKPFTYRLDLDTDQQVGELRVSGETTGVIASIDGNIPALPSAGQTSLLLPYELVGQVFWGSLSRQATSRATWSFLRYGLVPDQVFIQGHAVVNNTEMSDLPEDNPPAGGGQWFPSQTFGTASIGLVDELLLKATSASDSYDLSYSYSRVEPFFTPDAIFDYRAQFQLDTTTLGYGGAGMFLDDTQRRVQLRSLLIKENLTADPTLFRGLINLPQVSHTGIFPPETLGWAAESGSTLEGVHEGAQMVTTQDAENRGRWSNNLDWGEPGNTVLVQDDDGRVLEARLAVTAVTPNAAGDTGILFGCHLDGISSSWALVQVELAGTTGNEVVRLRTATGAAIASYVFDWNDGEPHTYRALINRVANTVTLLIDDTVQAPAVGFDTFDGGSDNTQAFFGCTGRDITNQHDDTITATVEWHYIHAHVMAPDSLVRTVGVLRGAVGQLDEADINSYEIPRIDTSTAPNSWATGPTIELWDWRQPIELRVYRDPQWGVTVFRPDLPPPPYYVPEDGTPGSGFSSESNEPSAGWINVEYHNLPRTEEVKLGLVEFGDHEALCISQARWDYVRYRMFKHPTEDRIAPEHMVLNQFNMITSGEMGQDVTLETVIVPTMDKTRLSLLPTHLYAESVYKVIDGLTIWTADHWSFDPLSQLLTFQPDPVTGEIREFSSEHANVTVVFLPGQPVTNTYLARQPFLDGVTLLNEGTPPVPKSQTAQSIIEIVYGSHLNDPEDVLNDDPDFVLNDPHRTLQHKDVEGSFYENLEFIEVTDDGQTGLIASICERGPGQGFSGHEPTEGEDTYSPDGLGDTLGGVGGVADHFTTGDKVGLAVGAEVFDFSGTMFWHDANFLPTPDFDQQGGMPGGILFASGGNFVNPVVDVDGDIIPGVWVAGGGHIGPGSAVLYPSYPAKGPHGGPQGRIYQRTDWYMDIRSVLVGDGGSAGSAGSVDFPMEEDISSSIGSDSYPPTGPANWQVNPKGAFSANGAAYGLLQGMGDYSRYGPWGGWDALAASRDWAAWVFVAVVEGTQFPVWDRVGVVWIFFTARAVPVGILEFLLTPNPHTALATAINTHPVLNQQYEAIAGLALTGQLMVSLYARVPSTTTDPALFDGEEPAVQMTNHLPIGNEDYVMSGGSKVQQSSLLAGGTQTIDHNNAYDARLGMVALGGSELPVGAEINLIFSNP